MSKVLLVDDEESLHTAIRELLEGAGYEYCGARGAQEALAAIDAEQPDLLLLDVMLPGMNGFDLCRKIRARGDAQPVIFVSAKNDIVDKSIGFSVGGDDYVTKPFSSEELLLRVEANIRRYQGAFNTARKAAASVGSVAIGGLEVRLDEYQVLVDGRPVQLTAKEFEIVAFLAANPGKVFTRAQIYEYIWNEPYDESGSNNITVFVRKIREKIEKNPSEPRYLLTVQRIGYKMAAQ